MGGGSVWTVGGECSAIVAICVCNNAAQMTGLPLHGRQTYHNRPAGHGEIILSLSDKGCSHALTWVFIFLTVALRTIYSNKICRENLSMLVCIHFFIFIIAMKSFHLFIIII